MRTPYVVSGATGFLGGRLVEILLEMNVPVIALGRDEKKGAQLLNKGAQFICVPLSDEQLLSESIPEHAFIIHCAALSTPWGKYKDFFESNVLGTKNLAKVARKKNAKRFVHVSTPSIYSKFGSQFNISENDPLPKKSINDYAKTKLLAEHEIDRETSSGLMAITLRPQGIFGPKDPSIFPRLIRVAKKGFIPLIGTERVFTDLTYVDNVCAAIICAINAESAHIGKKYNITNGTPVEQKVALASVLNRLGFSVREKKIPFLAAFILSKSLEFFYQVFRLKNEPILTLYSVYTLAFSRTLNIDAAKKDLNYSPKVTVEEGIESYIKWYNQFVL